MIVAILVSALNALSGVPGLFVQPNLPATVAAGAGIVISLLILCLGLAVGVAIVRYRLWDIDLIIQRTLVYGVFSACVIGLYILIVRYIGALFQTPNNSLISLIAERLVLSPKTVCNYISEIYSKLQVTDRIQAVLLAREAGLS